MALDLGLCGHGVVPFVCVAVQSGRGLVVEVSLSLRDPWGTGTPQPEGVRGERMAPYPLAYRLALHLLPELGGGTSV